MNWICTVCGRSSRSNRRKCPTCGSAHWRPIAKRDIRELEGPTKRVAPRGLLLANPGKQAPEQGMENIECGTCHQVIYRTQGVFDTEAFLAARKRHYSVSPACEERK